MEEENYKFGVCTAANGVGTLKVVKGHHSDQSYICLSYYVAPSKMEKEELNMWCHVKLLAAQSSVWKGKYWSSSMAIIVRWIAMWKRSALLAESLKIGAKRLIQNQREAIDIGNVTCSKLQLKLVYSWSNLILPYLNLLFKFILWYLHVKLNLRHYIWWF